MHPRCDSGGDPEPTASLYFDTLSCWDCMDHTVEQRGNVCAVVDVEDWVNAALEPWLLVPEMMGKGLRATRIGVAVS